MSFTRRGFTSAGCFLFLISTTTLLFYGYLIIPEKTKIPNFIGMNQSR